jgi:fatty acid amide hydrolase
MIPFVKSNVPQLAMIFESNNNLYGRAVNPWNPKRATGGSSGGEAGLLAAKCSPIGLGNDIGGSLRIPA